MFFFAVSTAINGQAIITPLPGNSTICPGQQVFYTLSPGQNFSNCGIVTWTLTNGSFETGNTVTTKTGAVNVTQTVFWNDVAGTGTIKATSTCTEGALSVTQTYAIKSLKNRDLGNPHAFQTLSLCSTAPIQIGVDLMFLFNTGGTTGITQQQADGYEWALPAGWTYNGLSGTVTSSTEYITISPDNGCRAGTVTVKAFMNCTSGKKYSNASTISLPRATPSITITPPAGYPGPGCGSTAPVTFTVNHNLTCLVANNAFQWVFPSGWNISGTFTNGNTITATPSGGALDGDLGGNQGRINVTITLACGTQVAATPYHLVFVAPAFSSNAPICDFGTTVTMLNVAPSVTVTWSPSSPISVFSGQGTPSALLKIPPNAGALGFGTINATVSCPGTTVDPLIVWAGTPGQPGRVTGETAPHIGSIYQYVCASSAPGTYQHDWILPYSGNPAWSFWGWQQGPIDTLVPSAMAGSSIGFVQVYGINGCGNGPVSKLKVYPVEGPCIRCPRIRQEGKSDSDTTFFKLVLYPNPANTEFKIQLTTPAEKDGELSLIDLSGNVKQNGIIQKGSQWITIGTSDVNPGIYVIKVNDGTKTTYRKVLIQH